MPPFLGEFQRVHDANPETSPRDLGLLVSLWVVLVESASDDSPPLLPKNLDTLTLCLQKICPMEKIEKDDVKKVVEKFFETLGDKITYRPIYDSYFLYKKKYEGGKS